VIRPPTRRKAPAREEEKMGHPEAFGELVELRVELRNKIAKRLRTLPRDDPKTLQYAVKAMLEANYDINEIAMVLGWSRSSVSRWSQGLTIPRSARYREFCVDKLVAHLNKASSLQHEDFKQPKKRRRTGVPRTGT